VAVNRVTPSGWLEETSSTLTRVTPFGWVQETTAAGGTTVAGTAATIAFAGVQGSVLQAASVTGTAATIAFTGVQGAVRQPVVIAGAAATVAFSGVGGFVRQDNRIVGTPAEITFTGVQGTISHGAPISITGTPAEITFTGVQGLISQPALIDGTAAEIAFIGVTGTVTLGSKLGGSLIRRRRSKHIYWDEEEELGRLLNVLGRHPTERDRKTLLAEARQGLTDLLISGQPIGVDYEGSQMLLETVGQQIRLQGALKKHVEVLMDDEDVMDILNLIA